MNDVLQWLKDHEADQIQALKRLVAIPSISTDGDHVREIDQSAALTCELMRQSGLNNVDILRCGDSYPYAYGEWLGAPGQPTVFLYSHHDVQPVNFLDDWDSDPWLLTERDGRLFGRGSADDKGAIPAQLWAIAAFLKTRGKLPINVKVLCEGEEEVGSKNLQGFFKQYQDLIRSDVIVVNDTENIDVGIPSITYSLRGIVSARVEVECATKPVHSGMAGGMLADAAIALNVILSRLYWDNGRLPIPRYYDQVRPLTASERETIQDLPGDDAKWRHEMGVLPGVKFATEKGIHPYEQTWRQPAITVIAQEASSLKGASNQVLPKATAIVSCRIVPDQDPDMVFQNLKAFLTANPPWGVKVTVRQDGAPVKWWMTDPNGPAFEAAMSALHSGFGREAVGIGCGGTIGFVGPLAELFDGAPALLLGIEDPLTNAHAPNESLHLNDFRKLTRSLAHLFENLGQLPADGLKQGAGTAARAPAARARKSAAAPAKRKKPVPVASKARKPAPVPAAKKKVQKPAPGGRKVMAAAGKKAARRR